MYRRTPAVIAIVYLLAASTRLFSASDEGVIGDITASSGEIYVRNRGAWKRLGSRNTRIYNTDKIVTVKGRSEITLREGGFLRLDSGTNVHIFKKEFVGSQLTSALSTDGYQVNLLVGEVSFDNLNTQNTGKLVSLVTPFAKVEYSSAAGKVLVSPGSETKFGVTSNSQGVRTEGSFQNLQNVRLMDRNDLYNGNYSLDPAVLNSPYINAVKEAAKNSEKKEQALVWAEASKKASKKIFNEFLKDQSGQNIRNAASTLMKNAQARYDYAVALSEASIASIEESQLEQNRISEKRDSGSEFHLESGRLQEEISDTSTQLRSLSLYGTSTEPHAEYINASAASAIAEHAVMLADSIGIIDSKMQKAIEEDSVSISSIDALLGNSIKIAERSKKLNSEIKKALKESGLPGKQPLSKQTLIYAAHTMMNTAVIASSCTDSLYQSSYGVGAGETPGFGDAANCQLFETAFDALEKTFRAIETGNQHEVLAAVEVTQKILKSLNSDDRVYGETYELISKSLSMPAEESTENIATEIMIPTTFEGADMPVDPMDLNSASNTR